MTRVFVTRGLTESRAALPILVRWKDKWPVGVLVCALAALIYAFPNRVQLSEARRLPLTGIDRAVPFLPWTVWIYWSGVLYLPAVYLANRCIVSMNKHLYSFLALVGASALIFLACPTTYPRELFPIPADLHGPTLYALKLMRKLDRPGNCAPSLHVSISYLIAFGFLEDRLYHPWPFIFVFGWATLMSVSTLTTKQHYAFDVVTGFAMAVAVFWLFHIRLRYRLSDAVRADLAASG